MTCSVTNFGLRAVPQGAARQANLRAEEQRRHFAEEQRRHFREFKDLDKTLSIQFRLACGRDGSFPVRPARRTSAETRQFFVCKLEMVLAT